MPVFQKKLTKSLALPVKSVGLNWASLDKSVEDRFACFATDLLHDIEGRDAGDLFR